MKTMNTGPIERILAALDGLPEELRNIAAEALAHDAVLYCRGAMDMARKMGNG